MSAFVPTRHLLAFLFALMLASSAFASDPIRFAPPVRYSAGTQPKAVAVGDLNNDGILDIVAASQVDQKVYVLLGKGDGTFLPAVGYSTANASPMGVVVADFTGDLKPDIAVATAMYGGSYPAYMVFPGNGDGTFGTPIITSDGSISPLSVKAADVNGDGKMDLVVAGNGHSAITYGNGDGTFHVPAFSPPPPTTTGDNQWAIAAADLNNDGRMDVFTGSYGGYVAVYLADANGSFQAPVNMLVLDSGEQGVTTVAAADINGDGFPDIVVSASNSNGVELLINKGDGTFKAPIGYYGGTTPTAMAFADFNGDGKLDVAFSDYNTSSPDLPPDNFGVSVIPGGAPDGTFDFATGFNQFDAGNHAAGIAVGDFNGDGLPDIVTADTTDNAVSVLLNGAAISVTLSPSKNPALPNESVTLSASVQSVTAGSPMPTGTVTFTNNASIIGSSPLDLSGNASITTSFALPAPGTYVTIYALYSGDANHVGSSGGGMYLRVGFPTTTTITASPAGPLPVGATTTLTATVSSSYGSPTGSAYFYDGAIRIGKVTLTAGSASFTTAALARGTHTFRASYIVDPAAATAGFLNSQMTTDVSVGPATSTVLVAPGAGKPGDAITLTATVTSTAGTPTGNVTFLDGSVTGVLGSAPVDGNGHAALVSSSMGIGMNTVTAMYSGDAIFGGSQSSAVNVLVDLGLTIIRPTRPTRTFTLQSIALMTNGNGRTSAWKATPVGSPLRSEMKGRLAQPYGSGGDETTRPIDRQAAESHSMTKRLIYVSEPLDMATQLQWIVTAHNLDDAGDVEQAAGPFGSKAEADAQAELLEKRRDLPNWRGHSCTALSQTLCRWLNE